MNTSLNYGTHNEGGRPSTEGFVNSNNDARLHDGNASARIEYVSYTTFALHARIFEPY